MKSRCSRVRRVLSVAVVLLGLPMTGCAGSSHSGETTSSSSCPSGTPGVTANSIKIGFVYPDTGGPIAEAFRPARSAVDARIALANANGGVHGRKIDLEWRDDEANTGAFALAAHDLVVQEGAFALIAQTVDLDQPTADWLHARNVPVTGLATSPLWGEYSNLFHFGSLFNKGGAVDTFGRYVKAQGGTKALVVWDPSAETSANLAIQLAPSLQSQGIQVVGQTTYSETVSNPAKVATLLRQDGADALIGAVQADAFIDIYAAAKAAGVKLNVALSASNYGPAQLRTRGADMAGMSMTMGYRSYTEKSPAITAYEQAVADYAPELMNPFDDLAITSYVAADEMVRGLELAGVCPTRQSFITNLRQVHDYDAGGLLAPTDLSRPADPDACFNFLKVSPQGDSYAPVRGNSPSGFWCGSKLPGGSDTLAPSAPASTGPA
ncbi:putative Leu/Ile/Val-binding protein precursor (LIV-BP) [Pseudofrankia inefficax]|uniref:Putative Leu/Ile/Val-binding protein (LIV-BP) n=2 Tax=Pseudofrankia inefficax (strain DSM 45817 / CECT 9037 / DDB 130130 / EuI1c) TaxID=298654 RepID=E3JDF0_PSEI1|nr:ABC transporter substrate-binding protein [Pseudofrankia inefficax]ADP83583.1 putative Leu/Ile/Val-binding protein precursor (LIV-BP) [Pseudofrankia inefficax]